jgi:outer membrane protein assembly factor BamB
MKNHLFIYVLTALFIFSIADTSAQSRMNGSVISDDELYKAIQANRQWPSYRGYFASGIMNGANLPDSFNVESSYNIKWNIEVPGLGLSCPVIWDDRIYITTAVSSEDKEGYRTGLYGDIAPVEDSSEHRWIVYCIDKESGSVMWEREAYKGVPMVKRHPKSSHANTTVATNGEKVVVFFGSEGLYCYDREGTLQWKRDFGLINAAWHIVESAEWEFCSSPVIFRDKVIIQVDALNTAFVAVLDLESGNTLWKKDRDEIPGWCTPNVYFQGDLPRVVLNGYQHRGAYDMESGEEVWKMSGGGDIPIPTPIVWKDLIFFNSAHGRHAPLMAIKNSASGTLSYPESDTEFGEHFAWFQDRGGAYMSSVMVYDDLLYRMRWNGNLACLNPRTGETLYDETVHPSSFIASPVAADSNVYLVSETGDVYIIEAGPEYKVLKKIPLGEVSLVTPGIAPGMIIFRTASRLIAVSDQ